MEHEPSNPEDSRHEHQPTSEPIDVTIEDVFALLSGTASLETRKRIAKAMYDPEHPLSYLARQSTQDEAFEMGWPPNDVPDAIRDLLSD